MTAPLRFHWRLIHGGDVEGGLAPGRVSAASARPALEAQIAFCREAEEIGIDSVLVDMGTEKPDPITLAMALAVSTGRLKFMVAHRPGIMSPTLFAQQVNTFSTFAPGRITLNVVAGYSAAEQLTYGDHAPHDERYSRMEEYLAICARLWASEEPVNFAGQHYRIEDGRLKTPFLATGRRAPEIYVGGGSENARRVASAHADCWLRFADTRGNVKQQAGPMRESGTEVGLRLSCMVRKTRQEALDAAQGLLQSDAAVRRRASEAAFVHASDAQSMREMYAFGEHEWLEPSLWAGAVRTLGAASLMLIGSPEEVATAILDFKAAGVSQFIFHGWPKWEEMRRFGEHVLPLVREREDGETKHPCPNAAHVASVHPSASI